jgi:hypothetical protein
MRSIQHNSVAVKAGRQITQKSQQLYRINYFQHKLNYQILCHALVHGKMPYTCHTNGGGGCRFNPRLVLTVHYKLIHYD